MKSAFIVKGSCDSLFSSAGCRSVILAGQRGARGRDGSSGSNTVTRVAGETISALSIVYERSGQIYRLGNDDRQNIELCLGLSLNGASQGGKVEVQLYGIVEDAAWAFSPGPVWLGQQGRLVQTASSSGFDLYVGNALGQKTLNINIQEPITLE